MDPVFYSPILAVVLLLVLASGIWVAVSLLVVALVGMVLFGNAPTELVMPSTIWSSVSGWTLTALPLFVWMGEILFRTRLADDLFNGLAPWTRGCRAGSCTSTSSAAASSRRSRDRPPRPRPPSARCRCRN